MKLKYTNAFPNPKSLLTKCGLYEPIVLFTIGFQG